MNFKLFNCCKLISCFHEIVCRTVLIGSTGILPCNYTPALTLPLGSTEHMASPSHTFLAPSPSHPFILASVVENHGAGGWGRSEH
jgi:hypothetical protein